MKFTVSRAQPEKLKVDVIAVGLFERPSAGEGDHTWAIIKHVDGGAALDRALGGSVSAQVAAENFKGERRTHRMLFTAGRIPARFIMLVGLGKKRELSLDVLREAAADMVRTAASVKAKSLALVLEMGSVDDLPAAARARALAEGAILGSYSFDRYKTEEESRSKPPQEMVLLYGGDSSSVAEALKRAEIVAGAQNFARDLVNTPGQDAPPKALVSAARRLAAKHKLACKVLGPDGIRRERMGGLMAVSRGSAERPAFIVLSYKPKAKSHGSVAIVGKGITFDSGGISIKPSRGMDTMKGDMAGAASVIAAMQAIAQLRPAVEVTACVPAAENMPDGKAVKPGDVIKMRSGKTVEITNTDAEGRLVVADALSYVADRGPDAIVELSTLTGGAVYCCGELYTLAMGTEQRLVDRLKKSAETAGEPLWQLPMVEDYKKGYKSSIADMNNTGKSRAQTIMGALFLREFAGKGPFVHLDIAASSWTDEQTPLAPKGGTGVMVRTLVDFVMGFRKG